MESVERFFKVLYAAEVLKNLKKCKTAHITS